MKTIEDVLCRLRTEFLEMPALQLKGEQVQRLCGIESHLCQLALDVLVNQGFLYVKPNGHYARVMDQENVRLRTAMATLPSKQAIPKAS